MLLTQYPQSITQSLHSDVYMEKSQTLINKAIKMLKSIM